MLSAGEKDLKRCMLCILTSKQVIYMHLRFHIKKDKKLQKGNKLTPPTLRCYSLMLVSTQMEIFNQKSLCSGFSQNPQ